MSTCVKFATALCVASCAAAIGIGIASQTYAQANQEANFFSKAGTDCMACTPDQFDVVAPMNNWTFQYVITTGNLDVQWANDKNVELVPMITSSSIKLMDGSFCTFRNPGTDKYLKETVTTLCTTESIVETLKDTQSQMKVPMKYLMGWNEPYVKPKDGKTNKKNQKYIIPTEGVEWWRNIVQPAAVETGLKLVTPTTAEAKGKTNWMSEFLAGCWAKRNEATNPCDVNLIKAFSVHDYKCSDSFWTEGYTVGTGYFQTSMIEKLEAATADDNDGEIDWTSYINDMPIWVQETSCNWDPTPPTTSSDVCKRLTQQAGDEFGKGSIDWFNAAPNVERWAWYTTFNNKDYGLNGVTRLLNADGELLPPGRALMSQLDSTVDCDALPLV